jgi:hypothetical protein
MGDNSRRPGGIRGEGVRLHPNHHVPLVRSLAGPRCAGCGAFSRTGRRLCDRCWLERLRVIAQRLDELGAPWPDVSSDFTKEDVHQAVLWGSREWFNPVVCHI